MENTGSSNCYSELYAQVQHLLLGHSFSVESNNHMFYAFLENAEGLKLQLNYFHKTNEVTCQMAGYGMNVQVFGTYKIASVKEFDFLLTANSYIIHHFPALHQ